MALCCFQKSDLYLPKKWPAYFSKAKKCSIWDLNGTKHDDVFLMGVGTNVLGYANKKIDEKVKKLFQVEICHH